MSHQIRYGFGDGASGRSNHRRLRSHQRHRPLASLPACAPPSPPSPWGVRRDLCFLFASPRLSSPAVCGADWQPRAERPHRANGTYATTPERHDRNTRVPHCRLPFYRVACFLPSRLGSPFWLRPLRLRLLVRLGRTPAACRAPDASTTRLCFRYGSAKLRQATTSKPWSLCRPTRRRRPSQIGSVWWLPTSGSTTIARFA